jgi:hypothetical protein
MAALGLLSALSAQSANIKISSLPFNITAPGTYVVTGDLTSPLTSYGLGSINITTTLAGPVILDLKGFTLTGNSGLTTGVTLGWNSASGNTYPITIRNGTLTNFGYGVITFSGGVLSNISINNVVFNPSSPIEGNGGCGIKFVGVNSSSVNNCTFSGYLGIEDAESQGGNSYNNDSFTNVSLAFSLWGGNVLSHCQFEGPPGN